MQKLQKIGYMALGGVFMLVLMMAMPVLASAQRQITAYFNNIRVVVDGVLITPRDGQGNIVEPFVVDGTTYLPVRAVAEALGRAVEWDGATQTVYIGARPGVVQYLQDTAPAFASYRSHREFSAMQSGGVDRFSMGGIVHVNGMTYGQFAWSTHNLNSRFTSLSGVVGKLDDANIMPETWNDRYVRFFADGRLVLEVEISSGMLPRDFTINLAGVNQLRIETLTPTGVGIGNPVVQ